MELSLKAPFAGTVTTVGAAVGDQVAARRRPCSWSRQLDQVDGGGAGMTVAAGRPRPAPAGAGHDLRGRPARRAAERADRRPGRDEGGVHPPAGRRRAAGRRGDQLRAPEVGAAARRRRGAARPCSATSATAPGHAGAGAQRARPRPGAGEGRRGTSRSSAAPPRRSRSENLNRSLDEQFAMFEPTVARARDARAGRPRLRLDVLRRPVGGRGRRSTRSSSVGKRLLDLGASQLSLGDTIGVGTPAHVVALLDAFNAAGLADDGSRCTSTTPTARRWPTRSPRCGTGSPRSTRRAGGLGGCPYAKSATGNLATEDLVWMLNGLGIETGVDLGALVATSAWMAGELGRPSPSAVVTRPRRHREGTMRGMSSSSCTCTSGRPKTGTTYLQDRLALNRAALARARRALPARPAGQPCSRPRSTCSTVRGAASARTPAASGTALVGRVRRHDGTVIVCHEILAGARPAQVRKAMADLEGSEVHLVYSARDLARQIPAEWQEGVKHRSAARSRLPQAGPGGRRGPARAMWFWRVQGLPDVLSRWGDGLPPERIHLVTVPQAGCAARPAVGALLHGLRHRPALGAGGERAGERLDRHRRDRPAPQAQPAAAARPACTRSRLPPPGPRASIVHETLAQRPDMTRVTLPPTALRLGRRGRRGVDRLGRGLRHRRRRRRRRTSGRSRRRTDEPWEDPDRPAPPRRWSTPRSTPWWR